MHYSLLFTIHSSKRQCVTLTRNLQLLLLTNYVSTPNICKWHQSQRGWKHLSGLDEALKGGLRLTRWNSAEEELKYKTRNNWLSSSSKERMCLELTAKCKLHEHTRCCWKSTSHLKLLKQVLLCREATTLSFRKASNH